MKKLHSEKMEKSISQPRLRREDLFFLISLTLISLLAAFFIWYCTQFSFSKWGFSDSAVYFASARNFALGNGLGIFNPDGAFSRLTIFAPFYSIVLGIGAKLGLNLFTAARWIDIITFGSFVFICGYCFYLITKSRILALSFSVLCFGSYQMIINFTSLLSEPLAFVFGFSGFLLTILFINNRNKAVLFMAGLFCGLGFTSRYAFVVFPATGVIILLIFYKEIIKSKFISIISYLFLALGPMMLWTSIELGKSRTYGGRSLNFEDPFFEKTISTLNEIFQIIKYWLPYRSHLIRGLRTEIGSPILIVFFSLIILIGLIVFIKFKKKKEVGNDTPFILAMGFSLLLVIYLLFIISSNVFTWVSAIRERTLSPMLPMLFGMLLSYLFMIQSYTKIKAPFTWLCSLIIVAFFVGFNYTMIKNNAEKSKDPYPAWIDKQIFTKIDTLQLEHKDQVFSNGPDITLFYTHIYPYYFTNTQALEEISSYSISADQLDEICKIYVLFRPDFIDPIQREVDPISKETIHQFTNVMNAYYLGSEGVILFNNNCDLRIN